MISVWSALVLADAALRILLGLHLLMSRRSVPVTLAWLVALTIPVPFVGVFSYALVGEVRLGRWRVVAYKRLTEGYAQKATVFWRGGNNDWTDECAEYRSIANVATIVGDMPPLRGNSLAVLADAEHMIEALVRDIDNARSRIHMLYYIWMHTGAGLQVVEALERAAARGVTCRVLVDGVGSKHFIRSELPERLRKAGVKFAEALPVNPIRMLFARIDVRNHRKISVIDGWIAYTGSQNITDSSFGYRPLVRVGPWIDASIRVEGPAAQALEVVFLRDWEIESGERLGDRMEDILPDLPIPPTGTVVQIVPSGPGSGPYTVRDALITALFAAKEEIIMTTPYFVPDEPTKEALIAAALRGVQTTVVVPERSDGLVVGAASRAHFVDLLEAGVRIFRYREGLLHAKTITIDSDVAMIGSTNMDVRSFFLNYEVSALIFDDDQASILRMLQVEYMQDSTEVVAADWKRRPAIKRFAENLAKLFTPLL
ncbi:MAG: cardiolipin synthase [Phycisphaeraceae bacterium]|nr:cardiolipin synthase [Phycisphaeraceae bacterium]